MNVCMESTDLLFFAFFSADILSPDLDCIAISHDARGALQKAHVEKCDLDSPAGQQCFRSRFSAENVQCGGGAACFGALVCKIRSHPTAYFPVSFFKASNGLCAFNDSLPVRTMQDVYSNIGRLRGKHIFNST